MKVTTIDEFGNRVVTERPTVPAPVGPADPPRRVDIETEVAALAVGLREARSLAAVRDVAGPVADRLNR